MVADLLIIVFPSSTPPPPCCLVFTCVQASVHLLTMQNQFSHHAVDYSYHVNNITCNKGYEIVHSVSGRVGVAGVGEEELVCVDASRMLS